MRASRASFNVALKCSAFSPPTRTRRDEWASPAVRAASIWPATRVETSTRYAPGAATATDLAKTPAASPAGKRVSNGSPLGGVIRATTSASAIGAKRSSFNATRTSSASSPATTAMLSRGCAWAAKCRANCRQKRTWRGSSGGVRIRQRHVVAVASTAHCPCPKGCTTNSGALFAFSSTASNTTVAAGFTSPSWW